jgi:hypothetical protein
MPIDLAKLLEGSWEYRVLSAMCPCKPPSLADVGTDRHGPRPYEPFDLRFCHLRSIPHLCQKGTDEEPVAHRLNRCPAAGFHLTHRLHLYYGGKDLKAERAPQPDRGRIGFDDRIELLRAVAVHTCLVQDTAARSRPTPSPRRGRWTTKPALAMRARRPGCIG